MDLLIPNSTLSMPLKLLTPSKQQPDMTQSLTRLPDWHTRFINYIADLRIKTAEGKLTFSWDPRTPDAMNCLVFASGAVEALTGRNWYTEMGKEDNYSDVLGAYKALKSRGLKSVDQLIGSLFKEIRPSYATTGDLIIIAANGSTSDGTPVLGLDQAVAIAEPPFYWCVSAKYGLSKGRMSDAQKAYRV